MLEEENRHHQLDELENDIICLSYKIENFRGKKGGLEYKKLKSELKQIYSDIGEVKIEDETTKSRFEVILRDITKFYDVLKTAPKNSVMLDTTTYFLDIEEKVDLSKLSDISRRVIAREEVKGNEDTKEDPTDQDGQNIKDKLHILLANTNRTKENIKETRREEVNVGEIETAIAIEDDSDVLKLKDEVKKPQPAPRRNDEKKKMLRFREDLNTTLKNTSVGTFSTNTLFSTSIEIVNKMDISIDNPQPTGAENLHQDQLEKSPEIPIPAKRRPIQKQ